MGFEMKNMNIILHIIYDRLLVSILERHQTQYYPTLVGTISAEKEAKQTNPYYHHTSWNCRNPLPFLG